MGKGHHQTYVVLHAELVEWLYLCSIYGSEDEVHVLQLLLVRVEQLLHAHLGRACVQSVYGDIHSASAHAVGRHQQSLVELHHLGTTLAALLQRQQNAYADAVHAGAHGWHSLLHGFGLRAGIGDGEQCSLLGLLFLDLRIRVGLLQGQLAYAVLGGYGSPCFSFLHLVHVLELLHGTLCP